MPARAESIMAAVKTLLTDLTTTGANIQRGQVYHHQAAKLPALSVFMGSDTVNADYQTGLIDWDLTIYIESTIQVDTDYSTYESLADQEINAIREEVHAALMADHTLGLSYVIEIEPVTAERPNLSGEGDNPIASQVLEFVIRYRTSRTDISA